MKLTDLVPIEAMEGWYCCFVTNGLYQIKNQSWTPHNGTDSHVTPVTEDDINLYWDREYFHFVGQEITLPALCASCDRHNAYNDYLCEECRCLPI